MDADAFRGSPIGRLQPIEVVDGYTEERFDHFAYVPAPLPDALEAFDLDAETWRAISEADQALGRLDGAGSQVQNPLLLVRPTIRREAVSTSALEGTYTDLAQVLEAEAAGDDADASVHEVRNYIRAAETGLRLLDTRPTSLNLINELHAILMKGTRGDSWESGQVRQRQNWIGPHNCRVTESYFVPPPPGDALRDGLTAWERWLHRDDDVPVIVRLAATHYQFETLHPYTDGNGRLGRLIVILHLIERGVIRDHLLSISPYFEPRRREYSEHLRQVSKTGDFNDWIRFFARGLTEQAGQSLRQIQALLAWRERTVTRLRDNGVRGVALQIAEELAAYPVVTVSGASSRYGVTYPAANAAIKRLVAEGVLEEVTGRNYGRVFSAQQVFRIIDGGRH